MDNTIVFILTSSINTNSIKRIDEFISKGYKVKAYGFKRSVDVPNISIYSDIDILGIIDNNLPYHKRLSTLLWGIRRVLKETKKIKSVYYLVGLDIAIFFRLLSKAPYFYEEADLVHTNEKMVLIRNAYELLDKRIIAHSLLSSFRSEGFVKYHFGNKVPENVYVIPNRLNPNIRYLNLPVKKELDVEHLKFGYVGFIRYASIYNFVNAFCSQFPQHEFHFYGTFTNDSIKYMFSKLNQFQNCFFHGTFRSPDDLPKIYSEIDLVLSTYDVTSINVRYAEPNKIYEAIYFETPIIVSSNTFLADKVKQLGIGFDIDAMNNSDIVAFVNGMNSERIKGVIRNIKTIEKDSVINLNNEFFEKVKEVITQY